MGRLEDLEQKVALLQAQVDAQAPVGPDLDHVLYMRDVNVGLTTPLTAGDTLVWDATQRGFVNGTASSGFPIVEDDGTYTHQIVVTPGGGNGMHLDSIIDAGSVLAGQIYFFNGGGIQVEDFNGGGKFFNDDAGGGTYFNDYAGGGTFLYDHSTGGLGGVHLRVDDGVKVDVVDTNLYLRDLPTSAPGVSHAVWNDSGTLKITP